MKIIGRLLNNFNDKFIISENRYVELKEFTSEDKEIKEVD